MVSSVPLRHFPPNFVKVDWEVFFAITSSAYVNTNRVTCVSFSKLMESILKFTKCPKTYSNLSMTLTAATQIRGSSREDWLADSPSSSKDKLICSPGISTPRSGVATINGQSVSYCVQPRDKRQVAKAANIPGVIKRLHADRAMHGADPATETRPLQCNVFFQRRVLYFIFWRSTAYIFWAAWIFKRVISGGPRLGCAIGS